MNVNLMVGDCIERMREMADNSVDSVVTDPPYELGFMGKAWDSTGIANSVEMWKEVLRVLKPGGHLLAFSGSRTYHRMTCAIEDAGFEVRDQIMWVYGSGFPKSLDVSKAIDKAAGAVRVVTGTRKSAGGRTSQPNTEGIVTDALIDITEPFTEAAKQWQGFGTALKPAHEPICVARKPLAKGNTLAANVLQHGTGALNIDASRIGEFVNTTPSGVDRRNAYLADAGYRPGAYPMGETVPSGAAGRWPANLIHDGSDEVLELFPAAKAATQHMSYKRGGGDFIDGIPSQESKGWFVSEVGTPARFFYCAKTSKKDRGEGNSHPTVKPTDLMRYLVRLVTPPNGTVLDPFMGSGSTGKAAIAEGFNFIGIDMDEAYVAIAKARMGALELESVEA